MKNQFVMKLALVAGLFVSHVGFSAAKETSLTVKTSVLAKKSVDSTTTVEGRRRR